MWDNTKKAQNRMPTAVHVRRLRANNAQKMSQIGAGFTLFQTILGWFLHIFHPSKPVDFDQFNRLDFDTVVQSGQPSLF